MKCQAWKYTLYAVTSCVLLLGIVSGMVYFHLNRETTHISPAGRYISKEVAGPAGMYGHHLLSQVHSNTGNIVVFGKFDASKGAKLEIPKGTRLVIQTRRTGEHYLCVLGAADDTCLMIHHVAWH